MLSKMAAVSIACVFQARRRVRNGNLKIWMLPLCVNGCRCGGKGGENATQGDQYILPVKAILAANTVDVLSEHRDGDIEIAFRARDGR